MIVNAEVTKNNNENSTGLIRRFTRRVQGTGIIRKVKSIRYAERKTSKFVRKKNALRKIKKTKEIERLKKFGKI